jgi:hypothetical protein
MPITTEGQAKAQAEDEQIDNFETQIEEMEAESDLDGDIFANKDAFGGVAG